MAYFSATQLQTLSWTSWINPNVTYRTPKLLFYPKPLRASFSSSNVETTTLTKDSSMTTLRELCYGHVQEHVIRRAEEVGYVIPTEVQLQALPFLFSGRDCVLHAQTGSGKTLAYLLQVLSVVDSQRFAVQALIVVPTRELGMQVTKVTRMLAANPSEHESGLKSCTVMALLDGGMLKRHKSWLKAEPPTIVVATIGSLCQMLEKHILKLDTCQVLVVDEVDFMFNSSKEVSSLKRLLTSYSSSKNRQTIFASASIPQHRRFLYDCMQQKWTRADVVHVHVNSVEPMPSCLYHRFVVCNRTEKNPMLLSLLQTDSPGSAIIFVSEQSGKSKKAGSAPSTTLLVDFLKSSRGRFSDVSLLEEDMNFNQRAASLSELRGGGGRGGGGYLLVATDIAARGVDLPETTHIYNFDIPKDAVNYLHRAGRTGRKPFSDKKCFVTSIITVEERFVLQRFENELMFCCEQLFF
ncbi:DEAD-box ATP-dependent RNA helicase 58, chloroplastic isoform X3 [Solanum stenotomum]|uniref:DEAD-box ATP-dependent RNA helicase 58, chloroplastic isoform X3 n=1 Tax=Solanum stenotomum TaxID=172797 RepID=UPI0020D0BEEF|nr:DEAD-box ATP-dependent RNA helicase 58, chloroplastic isoform X3 [Solanum stenotomum]